MGKKKEEKERLKHAWELGRHQSRMHVSRPAGSNVTMSDNGDIESFMKQHSGPKTILQQQKDAKKRRDKAVKQIMKTEERKILKYLYMEGYADSYEKAEIILELMSDEWFEQILND